jgi:hypothetical protein
VYIGGDNVNYAYDEEQRVLITKDVLERARKDEGTIKDLAEKHYHISRKTFYNYRDFTRDVLAKYGYEIRHIYDLTEDDLKAMVHGTYQRKDPTEQPTKEIPEKSTEKVTEEITETSTKKSTEPGLIDDLLTDLKKTEEVKNDIDEVPKPKETVLEEKEEKKNTGWFKYAIYGVIALIAIILVLFLSKPKEKKEETINTQSSYKDEFEGFVMF